MTNYLKKAGLNVKEVIPKEGVTGWSDSWMLSKKAKHPICAYKYMNYVTRPDTQVKVVDVTYDEKAKQNKTRERLQAFECVCIARQGEGLNESFTVRKISYGEGVERVFPVHSPLVDSVQIVRKGKVRRAKLYYLRGRRGKSARIAERQGGETESAESET